MPVTPGPAQGGKTPGAGVFGWLLAWVVAISLLWLVSLSDVGKTTLYYLLWLSVVLLLVTQSQWFSGVLRPLQTVTANQGAGEAKRAPFGEG